MLDLSPTLPSSTHVDASPRRARCFRNGTRCRVLAVAMVCAAVLPACSPSAGSGQFSSALWTKLQAERPAEVDLATVSGFAWDELFALAPYSQRDDNCKAMQLDFLECRTTVPETVAEGEYFFVFRAKGKIVRAERHLRRHGDFAGPGLQRPLPILRTNARFKVVPVAPAEAQAAPAFRLEHIKPDA